MGNDRLKFLELRLKGARSRLGKVQYQQYKGLPYDQSKIDYYQDQIKTLEAQLMEMKAEVNA